MARRNTRNKIRWHADKAVNNIDRAIEQLQKLDLLAAGRSDEVERRLPKLVVILESVRQLLMRWRNSL